MRAEPIFLSGIAYQLGSRMKIEKLDLSESDLRVLREDNGIRYFRRSDVDIVELALSSIRKTLNEVNAKKRELNIDALIFSSNSFSKYSTIDIVARIAKESALSKSETFFVTTGDCCNFQNALALAVSLIAGGTYRDILLVTADRVADACEGQPLAIYGGGVNSDASASCLVTTGVGEFRILGAPCIVRHPRVLDTNSESTRLSITLGALRKIVRGVVPQGNCVSQINQVLPNTYTKHAAELVELATAVPGSKVFTDNVARTGHCFAADNLINLADYMRRPGAHGLMVLLGSGVFQWGAIALEYEPTSANAKNRGL